MIILNTTRNCNTIIISSAHLTIPPNTDITLSLSFLLTGQLSMSLMMSNMTIWPSVFLLSSLICLQYHQQVCVTSMTKKLHNVCPDQPKLICAQRYKWSLLVTKEIHVLGMTKCPFSRSNIAVMNNCSEDLLPNKIYKNKKERKITEWK